MRSGAVLVAFAVCAASACGESASTNAGGTGGSAGSSPNQEAGAGVGGLVADGGVSGGGPPEDCARILATLPLDDETHEWRNARTLPGGVFRTDRGLHFAFAAHYRTTHPLGLPNEFIRTALVLETFDPKTGVLLDQRAYDVFPADVTGSDSAANGVALGPDGRVLFSYGWYDPELGTTPQRALLVDLADAEFRTEVPLLDGLAMEPLFSQAAWDGQAFVIHSYDVDGVYSLRVTETGELVEPLELFGTGVGEGYSEAGHRVSTDPTSGVSYVVNDLRVAAHDRDGAPLPWLASDGYQDLFPEEVGLVLRNRVSADKEGGGWMIWTEDLDESLGGAFVGVTRIGNDGALESTLRFTLDDGSIPRFVTVLARGDGTAWFGLADSTRIFQRSLVGDELGPLEMLLEVPDDTLFSPFELSAFEWGDETWLTFSQANTGIHAPEALLAKTGCVYYAHARP
jgi:hypothetical protein